MLRFKVILLGWLLINLTYGLNELKCTIQKQKPNETNIECPAPGTHLITQLTAKKFDKKSVNYTDRFLYKMNFTDRKTSVAIWVEKDQSWISSSDFKVYYPAKTYMEPMQEGEWYNANIKMSNIAPEGISTIIQ
jgi:hypothetical protein